MRAVIAHLRSFWHGLRKPAQVDADMADEMRFHIEMETQRLMRQGLDPQEAAIGAGEAYLEFVNDLLHGKLPFPDADRIVGIQHWDRQTGDPEDRVAFDFVSWRDGLASFETVGAYRVLDRGSRSSVS